MRGEILQYDDMTGRGLISGDDGVRYSFARADLQRLTPLAAGMRVDFVNEGTGAREIFLIEAKGGAVVNEPSNEDLSLWGYFGKCLTKYVDGEGRARRKEYWSFVLFTILFFIAAIIADFSFYAATHPGFNVEYGDYDGFIPWVFFVVYLGLILPSITVTIRRLHDLGMTGWLYLLVLIPYLGGIFIFVCTLIPSQQGSNKHGPYPKAL